MVETSYGKLAGLDSLELLIVADLVRSDHLKSSNRGQLALLLYRKHSVSQSILLRIILGHYLNLILLLRILIFVLLRRLRLTLSLHVQQYILRVASERRSIVVVCMLAMVLL